jgi:hypothetical protein
VCEAEGEAARAVEGAGAGADRWVDAAVCEGWKVASIVVCTGRGEGRGEWLSTVNELNCALVARDDFGGVELPKGLQ